MHIFSVSLLLLIITLFSVVALGNHPEECCTGCVQRCGGHFVTIVSYEAGDLNDCNREKVMRLGWTPMGCCSGQTL